MNAPEHIKAAGALLVSCQLPGIFEGSEAEQYPATEDGVNSIGNALLAAQTHAMLAQVQILSAIFERMTPPAPAPDLGPKLCGREIVTGVTCDLPYDHTDAHAASMLVPLQ